MSENSSISRFKNLTVPAIAAIAFLVALILGGSIGAGIYFRTKKAPDTNPPDDTSRILPSPNDPSRILLDQCKSKVADFEGELSALKVKPIIKIDKVDKIVDLYKAIEAEWTKMAELYPSLPNFIGPQGLTKALEPLENSVTSTIDHLIEKSKKAEPEKMSKLKSEAEALVSLNISKKYDSDTIVSELMGSKEKKAEPEKMSKLKSEAEALVSLNISKKYDSDTIVSELMGSKEKVGETEAEKELIRFSRTCIPKDYQDYFILHFSSDIYLEPTIDRLFLIMRRDYAKEFLLHFIPFLNERIAKCDEREFEAKSRSVTLHNCAGKLILINMFGWKPHIFPSARSDVTDFSGFPVSLSETIYKIKDDKIKLDFFRSDLLSLYDYYEENRKSFAILHDIFCGIGYDQSEVKFFETSQMAVVTALSFIDSIDILPDLLKDTPGFQASHLFKSKYELFRIFNLESNLLETSVNLFLNSDDSSIKDKAKKILDAFDHIYKLERTNMKIHYSFLKARAILCASKNDSVAKLKEIQMFYIQGKISTLFEYVAGLNFEKSAGIDDYLHPGKSELDVLQEFISSGIKAGHTRFTEPRILRLFDAILKVKITGDKLRKFDELRFARFSGLLDSVIYPYSKRLNEDKLAQVKGSPFAGRDDPLSFMLEPIRHLASKLNSLNLVYGIYIFHKSDAIDALDKPVKLVLCYLDALIEKYHVLLRFLPDHDPEVFDGQEYTRPPGESCDWKKDPRYNNFIVVTEALRILGEKIFAEFSYHDPLDLNFINYKKDLDTLINGIGSGSLDSSPPNTYSSVAQRYLIPYLNAVLESMNVGKPGFPDFGHMPFVQLLSDVPTLTNLQTAEDASNFIIDLLNSLIVAKIRDKFEKLDFLKIKESLLEVTADEDEIHREKDCIIKLSFIFAHFTFLTEFETLPLTLVDGTLRSVLAPSTDDPYVLLVWNQFYHYLKPKLEPILERATGIDDKIVKESFNQEIKKIDVREKIQKLSDHYIDAEANRIIHKVIKHFTYSIN